ncbi:MAG: hypothetical protein JSS49_18050 [Planctomycetes bacterium]|nr:hypothetical protein [Planctomycetota bacterium]
MFGPKLKLTRDLYERLQRAAAKSGYSSVEELAQHVLEKAVADIEVAQSEKDIRNRLQGLGYLESS